MEVNEAAGALLRLKGKPLEQFALVNTMQSSTEDTFAALNLEHLPCPLFIGRKWSINCFKGPFARDIPMEFW